MKLDDAICCLRQGHSSEAEQICQQILAANPRDADAWHLRGIAWQQLGQHERAVDCFRRALAIQELDGEAHNNLGVSLQKLQRTDEALGCFRRAVELHPSFAAAHGNLGGVCLARGDLSAALSSFERAIALDPANDQLHFCLGNVYRQLGDDTRAAQSYLAAVHANPSHAEALSNLGGVFKQNERLAEATVCFRQALALRPGNVELQHNLACGLLAEGDLQQAAALWEGVIAQAPEHAEAHYNRALLWLLAGDFSRGLPELEWRWRTSQQQPRGFAEPVWRGEALEGRTILLHAEQGFGDTLQFVRYATYAQARGGRVVLECQPALVKLLAGCSGIDQVVASGETLPPFAVHAPLVSLPGIVGTRLETIPATVPYVFADEGLVHGWRERLAGLAGVRVGIHWRGRPGKGTFRQRDIPLGMFQSLTNIAGVRLISLQRGEGRQDLLQSANGNAILDLGDDVDRDHGAFMDTAAIMKNLDLVITSDTAVAHLAGALAVPVWLALPFVADWRWFLNRTDSPWYPTLRLFRQPAAGDWAAVFAEIERGLRGALAK